MPSRSMVEVSCTLCGAAETYPTQGDATSHGWEFGIVDRYSTVNPTGDVCAHCADTIVRRRAESERDRA